MRRPAWQPYKPSGPAQALLCPRMAGAGIKAVLLIVALLCLEGAWALKCHNCSEFSDTCSRPVECPRSSQYCTVEKLNYEDSGVIVSAVDKRCVDSCLLLEQSRVSGIQDLYFYCCATDLCNSARGLGLDAATSVLILVPPVLATLLGASL
ncbi:ly-6/neurotoxin-like protein 1 [Erinaceus europaeus]|uniref:Ly-6/neurotoxin-like protein 1 n=1 Tax=Erinaceus europaeus TaxID=9365 RepID=A0ABM3XSS6_ERIEU|nr:ly-6/neurotoxin-like protein 1 [Erinaceus europaeus]